MNAPSTDHQPNLRNVLREPRGLSALAEIQREDENAPYLDTVEPKSLSVSGTSKSATTAPVRRPAGSDTEHPKAHTTIELLRAETEARVDAALSHIRQCLHIGLQDAKLHGEAGRTRIGEWADFIDEKIRHALHADEDNLRDVAAALSEASAPPATSTTDI